MFTLFIIFMIMGLGVMICEKIEEIKDKITTRKLAKYYNSEEYKMMKKKEELKEEEEELKRKEEKLKRREKELKEKEIKLREKEIKLEEKEEELKRNKEELKGREEKLKIREEMKKTIINEAKQNNSIEQADTIKKELKDQLEKTRKLISTYKEKNKLEAIIYMKDAEESLKRLKEEMKTHKNPAVQKHYMIMIEHEEKKISRYKREYPELFLTEEELVKFKRCPELFLTKNELKSKINEIEDLDI